MLVLRLRRLRVPLVGHVVADHATADRAEHPVVDHMAGDAADQGALQAAFGLGGGRKENRGRGEGERCGDNGGFHAKCSLVLALLNPEACGWVPIPSCEVCAEIAFRRSGAYKKAFP